MNSSHQRVYKHDPKLLPSGRKLAVRKSRGKSREDNVEESLSSVKYDSESKWEEQPPIDHRKEILSAFYSSLLQSIVADRETVGSQELITDEQVSDQNSLDNGEEVSTNASKIISTTPSATSAKSSSVQEQSSLTNSKKSSIKTSQEITEGISPESVPTCAEPPKPTIEKIVFNNGNIYEGETFNDFIKGNGTFHWSDGTVYEGQFNNGYPTGEGKMTLPDLSFYEGHFCNGFFHGKGTLNISSTPIHYSGNWKNGKKHGDGWLLYEPGNWYDGKWFEDTKAGIGVRMYKNGCKYKGNWDDNKKKGQGKMMWSNNDYYVGEWSEHLPDGYGEYTWSVLFNTSLCFPYYNSYKGSWIEGKRTGIGIMNFGTECGSKLGGTWYLDQKHGPGAMMCGNGKSIECNPLFQDDKPVHMYSRKSLSDIAEEENIDVSSQSNLKTQQSFKDILALINKKVALEKFPTEIILNITKNGMDLEGHNFFKLFDSISGNKKMWCPLKIPIHSIADSIDTTYYVDTSYEYFKDQMNVTSVMLNPTKSLQSKVHSTNLDSAILSEKSVLLQHVPCDSAIYRTENTAKAKTAEAFQLKNQIIIQLTKLTHVYDLYASFAKRNPLSFKPVLIRLFLWQLMRDIHLTQEGISLVQTDEILSRNPASCVETEYYPFEPIYFYQYVQSLIGCSWLMYLADRLPCSENFGEGFLATIFKRFLEDFVYRNAGNFTGSVLTDNKDYVPITAVYNLYLDLGEPLSVRTFLSATCTKKGAQPPCYYAISSKCNDKNLKDGYNAVSVADEIHYISASDTLISDNSVFEEGIDMNRDPFYKTLYTFRHLGKKTLTHCLSRICPKIMGPNATVDLSFKLTFLEFYEVLIRCALMKAEETRRNLERQLRDTQRNYFESFSVSTLSRTKMKMSKKKKSKKSILTF